MSRAGCFVVLEGPEGAGKSTLAQALLANAREASPASAASLF